MRSDLSTNGRTDQDTAHYPTACQCGAPLKRTYDEDTKWPWCEYKCGTMRAATGTEPFPDTGKMTERAEMCAHAIRLRKAAGFTTRQAAALWKEANHV